jgi:surface polysaccharide O-acyltransferase-like enzyme
MNISNATTAQPPASGRLVFLDWVRIIAFLLLILFHVGMYYVTWDWHVKSPFASDVIEPFMTLTSPWRLGLLFLVSGVASSFMLGKLNAGAFIRQRSVRLLVPLLFGMLVVVPPQPYLEVVEKLGYGGSYADFMGLYLQAYHGFCKDGHCLTLPTWNHLWFVAYLWVYTLLLGGLMAVLGLPRFQKLSDAVARRLTGWNIVLLPLTALALARLFLFARFPANHALVGDWYNHANYVPLFLLGALMARQPAFWARLDGLRWQALAMAAACWAFLIIYFALPDALVSADLKDLVRDVQRVVYALFQWTAVVAACGFAHRHLQTDGPARRYLTQAVFPVYILHQTLIVAMAHALKPVKLSPGLEGLVLVVLTLSLSFAGVEIVRRVRWLRPLFGLGKVEESGSAKSAPAGLPIPHAPQAASQGAASAAHVTGPVAMAAASASANA